MSKPSKSSVSLSFPLEVEDGWPPVAVECLPFEQTTQGLRALIPPLFIKDLSVGDVISVKKDEEGTLESWNHVCRSNRTTIWLLRLHQTSKIEPVLEKLRLLGCETVGLDSAGCYSIDVPAEVPMQKVDVFLAQLDSDSCAVAFPSMRHPE